MIRRQGAEQSLSLTPESVATEQGARGRIGATVRVPPNLMEPLRAELRLGPVAALGAALDKTWDMMGLILRMMGKMLSGQASLDNLSGPISIAQYAGQSAQIGLVPFISFLAVISVSLGVLNLLPIPILDGGHLALYLIEALRGGPLPEAVEAVGQRIGLGVLLALMGLAFYNDFARLLGG